MANVSRSGAILLTLELDQPYGGLVQISTETLKIALEQFKFVELNKTPNIK